MKKTYLLLSLLAIGIGVTSCGGDGEPDTNTSDASVEDTTASTAAPTDNTPQVDMTADVPVIPADYVSRDLSEFGMSGSIMVPAEGQVYEGSRITMEGEQSQIVVQNGMEDPRLYIWKSSKTMADVKHDIEGNTIELFEGYLIENDNSVFYYAKENIDNKDAYNFVCLINKDGETWQARAGGYQQAPLTKEQALMLYAMATSIE